MYLFATYESICTEAIFLVGQMKHDSFWPFWHMLLCGRQLEALWVLSAPSSGMTDLLGHAVGQKWFNLAILANVAVWQAAGGTQGALPSPVQA